MPGLGEQGRGDGVHHDLVLMTVLGAAEERLTEGAVLVGVHVAAPALARGAEVSTGSVVGVAEAGQPGLARFSIPLMPMQADFAGPDGRRAHLRAELDHGNEEDGSLIEVPSNVLGGWGPSYRFSARPRGRHA